MSVLIRNAKPLQRKSRSHVVTQTGPRTFQVASATSGNVYRVYVDESHVGDCTCTWGQYRRSGAGSGCSHVIAVHEHIAEQAGRRVSAWTADDEALSRQHRSHYAIGDNLILTTRKA